MIVIVAPYTHITNTEVFLGGSKKIRFFISIFSKITDKIILVNSAHNELENKAISLNRINIDGFEVFEITLATRQKRVIGKFLNLFQIKEAINLIDKNAKIDFFWFYNAYAFEMKFAAAAKKKFNAPLILEFEDWIFARGRGLSIKNLLDFYFWNKVKDKFIRIYAINSSVKNRVTKYCNDVILLPGVIPENLLKVTSLREPFSDSIIRIGYFGMLEAEKGVDILLKLIDLLPTGFELNITGSGSYENIFREKAGNSKNKFIFHGKVSDQKLLELISHSDILLNPHMPLMQFIDGVFPFKVLESVASGRPLISTTLNINGVEEIANGIQFVEDNSEAFLKAILNSKEFYSLNKVKIDHSKKKAVELFGESTILESLKNKFL